MQNDLSNYLSDGPRFGHGLVTEWPCGHENRLSDRSAHPI